MLLRGPEARGARRQRPLGGHHRDGDRLLLGDAASPVILLCKITAEVGPGRGEAPHHRHARAQRSAHGGGQGGAGARGLRRSTARSSGSAGGWTSTRPSRPWPSAVFELVPRATHVSILLSEERRRGALRADAGPLPRRRRGRRPDHDEPRGAAPGAQGSQPPCSPPTPWTSSASSESIMGANIRSTIGVPLWRGEKILGVIECDNRASSGIFQERDLDLLLVLGRPGGPGHRQRHALPRAEGGRGEAAGREPLPQGAPAAACASTTSSARRQR